MTSDANTQCPPPAREALTWGSCVKQGPGGALRRLRALFPAHHPQMLGKTFVVQEPRSAQSRSAGPSEGHHQGSLPRLRPRFPKQTLRDTDAGPPTTLRTGPRKVAFLCRQILLRTRNASTRRDSSPVLHTTTILCRRSDITAGPPASSAGMPQGQHSPPQPGKSSRGHQLFPKHEGAVS